MNTSNTKPKANELCTTKGCGDRAYAHDGFTGKCNVQGCTCESFVGTVEQEHPSSTFERMGGEIEHVARAINAACICGDEAVPHVHCPLHRSTPVCGLFTAMGALPCIRTKGHTGRCSPITSTVTVEERYAQARVGAIKFVKAGGVLAEVKESRKALGSSPLDTLERDSITYAKMNKLLPIETAVLTVDGIQLQPVRFVQLAVMQTNGGLNVLYAIDADGQLWMRGQPSNGKWQLDTMPVR